MPRSPIRAISRLSRSVRGRSSSSATTTSRFRAFHNVCRHRGARILTEELGSVGNIVCPYHYWTYGVDGALRHVETPPADFDPSCFSLRPVHARSVAGLIFLCLAEEPPSDFDEVAQHIEAYIGPHKLAQAKVAHRVDLLEKCNWKLTMENNRECYHCDGHPELNETIFPVYGYEEGDLPPNRRAAFERLQKAWPESIATYTRLGLPYDTIEELDTRPSGFRIYREPTDLAGESFTPDGKAAVSKLLTDFPTAKLGRVGLHLQPNAWFHVLSDHAVAFAAYPIAPDKTLVRSIWLVNADAEEGVDYDLDVLTRTWLATNTQDASFVERAHLGATSPAYLPGPYNPSEYQVEMFINWYIKALRSHVGIPEAVGA